MGNGIVVNPVTFEPFVRFKEPRPRSERPVFVNSQTGLAIPVHDETWDEFKAKILAGPNGMMSEQIRALIEEYEVRRIHEFP